METNRLFKTTYNLNPGRSAFDLSYSKLFNCNMGELVPVMHDEVVPGDYFHISNEVVVRFTPLVAPVLHEINVYVHYFFVSYAELQATWESFITGGDTGGDTGSVDRWKNHSDTAKYTLWDYFGFPVGVTVPNSVYSPIIYPLRAYNYIYNNYYRDEWLHASVNLDNQHDLLKRCWEKDYFTSALTNQQKGTAPAFPLTLTGTINPDFTNAVGTGTGESAVNIAYNVDTLKTPGDTYNSDLVNALNKATIDLSSGTLSTVDITDVRLTEAIQKWMERNARCGSRYTEFIRSNWGSRAAPRDERVDRPEYIGGTKQSVIVSEVLQTSETNVTDQGNMAGHAISVDANFAGAYKVKEYGLIMGILSIMPKPMYHQGINRQWLRETRYDFPNPHFVSLSEQAILKMELYMDGSATDDDVFGYQGMYDEMRCKQNLVCADMRDTFDYWHLCRQFSSVPSLNETFLNCTPRTDIFASTTEPGCIVHIANKIKAIRPIPAHATPSR